VPVAIAENTGIFLNVLREHLPSLRQLSDAAVEKKLGKEKFAEVQKIAWEFLDGAVSGSLTRNERYALLHKTVACLIRWMEAQDIPVTPNTLVNNAHLMPHAVDRAFPFYAKAKLLRVVIQSRAA
jgi:uncharacterized membrane-anchored protein YjiN (DUF445 family)